jgi:hypothetical protein
LITREKERYGQVLSQESTDFINWALAYDDSNQPGRNRLRHEQWMPTLPCPLLRIEAPVEVEEKIQRILAWMNKHALIA